MSADLIRRATEKLHAELPAWATATAFVAQTCDTDTDGVGVAFCAYEDDHTGAWKGVPCEDCEVIEVGSPELAELIVRLLDARLPMADLLDALGSAIHDEAECFDDATVAAAHAILREVSDA